VAITNSDVVASYMKFDAAQPKYRTAELFYEGEIGRTFGSERVQLLMDRMNIGKVEDFNFASIPVDAVCNKLQVTTVSCATYDGKPHEQAQQIISEGWKRNKLKLESFALHQGACEYGDYFVLVWPVFDADSKKPIGFDFVRESPRNMRLFYDEDSNFTKSHAMKWWCEGEGGDKSKLVHYMTLYYRDRIEFWCTEAGQDPKLPQSWVSRREDEPNPYGQVPVFHFRTSMSDKYGRPEHIKAYGPQRFINHVISNFSVTIDFMSYPQRYALMDPKGDDPNVNKQDPFDLNDADDDPEGEGHAPFNADPAAIWKLFGMTGVGQFNPADPSNFIEPLDRAVKSMAQLTETPFHYFDPSGDTPSGESLRTANEPLYVRAERLEMLFESEYQDSLSFALSFFGIEDVAIDVKWKAVRMVSDAEGWTVIAQKVALGVPLRQCLQEAGYEDELVNSWLNQGSDVQQRLGVLKGIADVIESLGASMALGIVDTVQVKKIVADLIGEAVDDEPKD